VIGRLAGAVAGVMSLPVLLLGAGGGNAAGSEQLTGGPPPIAYARGSDDAQVSALPPSTRAAILVAARSYALPPALLASLDPPDPAAAARDLLAAGQLPGGAWDAVVALSHTRALADVDAVLARAAAYGYRYSPSAPPLDPSRYVFPLRGNVSYGPFHHDYPATDIFAPIGTPALACVRAEVLRLSRTDTGKGGLSITLRGEDGWRYYYAHLSAVVVPLAPGDIVEPGQLLGLSGDTGDAHGTDPHLHFGISRSGNAQGQLSPYPYLQTWPHA
jgi:murein DD-endopeptidase MepM/ murein hydrolase activator NlpD